MADRFGCCADWAGGPNVDGNISEITGVVFHGYILF